MGEYVCNVCGYIYRPHKDQPFSSQSDKELSREMPKHWSCPVCGMGRDVFEQVERPKETAGKG